MRVEAARKSFIPLRGAKCFAPLFNKLVLFFQKQVESAKQPDELKLALASPDAFAILQSLRVATVAANKQPHSRSRQAEINRRIGFEPRPITPETTSHYQNLH